MQAFTQKLNVWQEVSAIESLQKVNATATKAEEKNQASQETWFDLLQYPKETDAPQGE
jgi:hypothetical protein